MADYVAPQPSRTELRIIALRQAVDTMAGTEGHGNTINRAQAFFDFLTEDLKDNNKAPVELPHEPSGVRPKDFS